MTDPMKSRHDQVRRDQKQKIRRLLHIFMTEYGKRRQYVYGFVEGKDDPSFYKNFIDHILPEGWESHLWWAEGRQNVLEVFKRLDWQRFDRLQICFFIDRDLSDFIEEDRVEEDNIYVTDGYSIENSIVNEYTFRRVLGDLCGIPSLSQNDSMVVQFQEDYQAFCETMTPVMALILYWRLHDISANLNNIQMKSLFKMFEDRIEAQDTIRDQAYLHKQCSVPFLEHVDITEEIKQFMGYDLSKLIRGKFVQWFFVRYLTIKQNQTFGDKDFVSTIAPRARCPQSLQQFLQSTYHTFLLDRKAAIP
ncbi:DUF4435 domain-containing protein [Magnetococcales bacterium HHB-1]